MKLKSTVIPLVLLIFVLASAFPVVQVEAKTVTRWRFSPVYIEIVPDKLAIEGWVHTTIVSKMLPQGPKEHLNQVVQFDVLDLTTDPPQYIGKGLHIFMNEISGSEDQKIVENIVSCSPSPETPGISYRLRVITIIENGNIKVDVYVEPLGPPDP